MGGYIGAKVGKLVTTAANVSGDATIGGNLTVKGTTITVDSATAQTVDLGDNDKIRLGDGDDLQIYHDATNSIISNATGDLTFDLAGDLVVNADGGNFVFQDDSVNVGELANSSSDFVVASLTQDKDILFKGNDGGSVITPVTIDMSEAGAVGIGTTTPSRRLAVKSNQSVTVANFESTSSVSGLVSFSDANTTNDVTVRVGALGDHLVLQSGGSERLRIDSSGKVGIGTTSPDAPLHVEGASGTQLVVEASSGNFAQQDFKIGGTQKAAIWVNEATDLMGYYVPSGWGKNFYTGGAERMRINQYGWLGLGRTDPVQMLDVYNGTNNQWTQRLRHDMNGIQYFLQFDYGGSLIGSVTGNNSSVTYATSSDYRLKENVTDVTDGITRVKQLAPKRFNFIADADTTVDGFLAHEAQAVVPEAITGTKDAVEVWAEGDELPDGVSVGDSKLDDDGNTIPVMQGIDQSKLVPLLTAALQEAIAEIEILKTKVAALEG